MEATDQPPTTEGATPPDPPPTNGTSLLKPIRQVVVFALGMSVLVVGILMVVLPGPATIVIPAGLAILATEFLWARRWLNELKRRARDVVEWSGSMIASSTASTSPPEATETPSATSPATPSGPPSAAPADPPARQD